MPQMVLRWDLTPTDLGRSLFTVCISPEVTSETRLETIKEVPYEEFHQELHKNFS